MTALTRALAPAAVTLALTVSGCATDEQPVAARSISQDELESQVAGMYPAQDDATTVRVECAGDLPAQQGATEDCRVQVNRTRARVRVSVTEVVAREVSIDSVLVVPASRVAQELLDALLDEGFHVEEVTCPDALLGRLDESVTCRATPNTGSGEVTATVTRIRGLRVDFDYAVS